MASKSCATCPSYLVGEGTIRTRFSKYPGVPMCGRFGHILGRPGDDDNTEILLHFASGCSDHNLALTSHPVSITPRVVKPDENVLAKGATGESLGTCNACSNLVLQAGVMTDLGYPLSICKAKGTLVIRPMQEAKGCGWASPGKPSSDASDLILSDHLQRGFKVKDSVKLKDLMGDNLTFKEPSTYESDLKVMPEDALAGIRAWRKYIDPETGNDYYMPIFSREFFTEEEQSRIPTTGVEFGRTGYPEAYIDHAGIHYDFLKINYTLSMAMCLIGDAGTGKSQYGVHLGWLMQVPVERFEIRPDMDVEDFLGHPRVGPEGDYWSTGRFGQRITRPGILILDELNAAPDPVKFFFRAYLDQGKINLDYGTEEPPIQNDYSVTLATQNPAWDARNIGTLQDANADFQRMTYVWVPDPPDPVTKHILRERCATDGYEVPDAILDKIVKISDDIKALSKEGTFPGTWGLRQDLKVARLTAHYGLVNAYRRAALDALEPDVAMIVIEAIESYGT